MPDEKFSQLPPATTPLTGSEIVPIVQGGQNRRTTSADLGAGGGGTPIFTPTAQGSVPASGGGTTKFVRADGSWQVPPGTGGPLFTTSTAGIVPGSGGGTTKFIRADGTWQVPPGNPTSLAVGSTPITGGTTGNFQVNNSGVLSENTPTQVTAALNQFTNVLKGVVPGSGGGTTNFLRADATWAVPPGGGSGTGWPNTINVADFGAVGNGSTDDTAALNAAFASLLGSFGMVLFPNGTYKITDTVTVGNKVAAGASFISIYCPGGHDGVTLSYQGPDDGRPALGIYRNNYFIVKGLGVRNDSGTHANNIAIQMGGTGSDTNYVVRPYFEQCRIDNFHIGIVDGPNGGFSEAVFNSIGIGGCDTGFTTNHFNTLDFTFINLAGGNNGVLIDTGISSGVQILGGGNTGSTLATFVIHSQSWGTSIRGFRDEVTTGMFVGAPSSAGNVEISDCVVASGSNNQIVIGPAPASLTTGNFGSLIVRDSNIAGWISSMGSKVTIQNCGVAVNPANRLPFLFNVNLIGNNPTYFDCCNNFDGSGGASPLDDFHGYFWINEVADNGTTGVQNNPQWMAVFQAQSLAADSGTPVGATYAALSTVRSLSEGPVAGGASSRVSVLSLVTNASSAAGTSTLSFASTAGIRPGLIAYDTTHTSAIQNFSPYRIVVSNTATVVTLSGTIAAPGVSSGDTIQFFEPASLPTPGQNLRIMGTFSASTTLAFTFKRNVTTVGTNLSLSTGFLVIATPTATNRFYPTDVGKSIEIVGVASGGWTNTWGVIQKYTDSSHVYFHTQPSQSSTPSFVNQTVTIGSNEPDANYVVAGIVSDDATPRSFSVSSITTTGFTITSSAATSANVTALIVR